MTKRSRIEGTLHRSLPASITIRAAQPGQTDDGLLRLQLSVSSEIPYLRTSWWDEPWIEVLGHKAQEVDLARFNGGAAVLANHDRYTALGNTPLAGIGKIESARLDGARLVCDIVISRREALADLRQDIEDGLVTNVSIGYLINERTLVKANGEGKPDEYRVTSWTPFEVSLVDVPADPTVGLGRSAAADARIQSPNPTPGYRVVDLSPAVGTTRESNTMDETTIAPATTQNAGNAPTSAAAQPRCPASPGRQLRPADRRARARARDQRPRQAARHRSTWPSAPSMPAPASTPSAPRSSRPRSTTARCARPSRPRSA